MRTLKKITFAVEEFALGTPAQQLVDRFLLGYPRDGDWHQLSPHCAICVHLHGSSDAAPDLDRRAHDHGLLREMSLEPSLESADAVVVVGRGSGATPNDAFIAQLLNASPRGSCCFVYGALGSSAQTAAHHAALAKSRSMQLLAGTPVAVLSRLPNISVPAGAVMKEALIVVQGPAPLAELEALEGLAPLIERRRRGEGAVRALHCLTGPAVWKAGESGAWSWDLLGAALSRSDSPQGDSVKDGRTQDLVRLGLVPQLAREPRAWILEHPDGLRSTVLVLDGVVADYTFALRLGDGSRLSAQLYRPPKPQQQEFSRLAAVLEDYFRSGNPPWPIKRSVLISDVLGMMRDASSRGDQRVQTPQL